MSPTRLVGCLVACSAVRRSSSFSLRQHGRYFLLLGVRFFRAPRGKTAHISDLLPQATWLQTWLTAYVVLCMAVVVQLAGLDPQRQMIARRRERAGGEGSEGAGWAVGTVEVERDPTVLREGGFEEPPSRVGRVAGGLVAKDEE